MKNRLTPIFYNMTDKQSNIMDDIEPLRKEGKSEIFNFGSQSGINTHDYHEIKQPVFTANTIEELPVVSNDASVPEEGIDQSELIGQLEEIDPAAIVISDEAPLNSSVESAYELEELFTEDMSPELDDISAMLEHEVEQDQVTSEAANNGDEELTYLAELEEMMMGPQAKDEHENSAAIMDSEFISKTSSFANELDELLKEVEFDDVSQESPYEQIAATSEEINVMDDEAIAIQNEENSFVPLINEDTYLEPIEEIAMQHNDNIESGDQTMPLIDNEIKSIEDERTNTIIENNVEENEEAYVQNQSFVLDNHAAELQEEQREVFQTILVQAEIAKKVLNDDQYEHFLQSYINYDRPAVECFTFASMLIEHYIKSQNHDALLSLLGNLEERFSRFPILLQEIHYLQAHYASK